MNNIVTISEISAKLIDVLSAKGLRLSTAESCTGGLVASSIIEHSGASQVFYEGLVTYSNEAKRERLGVNATILAQVGAVSQEAAEAMAKGCLGPNCEIAVSTTGIAGPSGGTEQKPVGLVWFAVALKTPEKIVIESEKQVFSGNRTEIRQQATRYALALALQYIDKHL